MFNKETSISILFPTAVGRCRDGKHSGGKSREKQGAFRELEGGWEARAQREVRGMLVRGTTEIFSSVPLFSLGTAIAILRETLPIWKQQAHLQTGWAWHWGRGTSHVPFNSCSSFLALVFEALRVCNLVRKAALTIIKMLKAYMKGVLFMCVPFTYRSLIFLLLIVLKKYWKMECSREHRAY